MKVLFFSVFFIVLSLSPVAAQRKNTLKAYLDHKSFYHPEIGNFVEIHLQFVSYSLAYKAVDGGLQSEVAVQYVFRSDTTVVKTDAYRLESPLMRDSIIEDFYDIKRIPLKPGLYTLELTLTDLNTDLNPVTAIQEIEVKDLSAKTTISDIETAEMMRKTSKESVFSKSGYDIIPRISNYFPTQTNSIPVYFEVYVPVQADTTKQIVGLKQAVRNVKTKEEVEAYTRFTKLELNNIQPIIRVLDISALTSGEYVLEYSLISKENALLVTREYFFERFNEVGEEVSAENVVLDPAFQASLSEDSLGFYVASLIPISRPAEARNIITLLKTKDKSSYRKYLQSYWVSTSGSTKAYESWLRYKRQVLEVQRLYGNNFQDGFETDRGRVFLQYGPPNSITTRENSPTEYPYEIWRYDKIKVYSNKRFVFYNPDLVNNGYRLLHSDLIGEVQNYRWQSMLSKRNSPNSNIDDPNDGNFDHYGGNSKTLFKEY